MPSQVGGPITRSEVLARAAAWVGKPYNYSQSRSDAKPDGDGHSYRPDCSGYVSMAFHLTKVGGGDYSTVNMPDVTHPIGKEELRPGDIMLWGGPGTGGDNGHVIIFAGWVDGSHDLYRAYEQGGSPDTPHRCTQAYPYGGRASRDFRFKPYRYLKIREDTPAVDGGVVGECGDVNGDGRADLTMMYHHGDGSISVRTAYADPNGYLTGFDPPSYTVPAAAGWDWNAIRLVSGDFNGDGRADLVMMYHHGDGSITLHTWLTDATGKIGRFSDPTCTIPAAAGWDWNAIKLT